MRNLPLALLLACALCPAARAGDTAQPADIADLSLEQLSDIVVTSVSRQQSRLSSAPASIYIISASDIHRSGARSLPEALRLAPNLQVARVDGRNYAISARGFNGVFANKLLVLIDGRSVYSPLFSGVFWDAQDVDLADVARIEVISGPGATIWGANAVNGVINVITKEAAETQGVLAEAGAGQHERGATVRYGGKLANGGAYRVYGKDSVSDDSVNAAGTALPTGMRHRQAGFRSDLPIGEGELSVSGDAYQGTLAQLSTRPIETGGANLGARYTARLAPGQDLRVQLIADHTRRDQPSAFHERLNTLDLEIQHDIRSGSHNLAWGGGYRYAWDRIDNGSGFGFLPSDENLHWGNLFAQDEISLAEPLRLTAGLKLEHNNYTGLEVLPNLRLAYTPRDSQLFWASLSRTVRAPSRIDRDFYAPAKPVTINGVTRYVIGGGPDFVSETANVAELGYRGQPLAALSWSATLFVSDYDRLRTLEPYPGAASLFENRGKGLARGLELWGRWQALPGWRLDGGAVLQRIRTRPGPGSHDASAASGLANNDPDTRYQLRSSHDLGSRSQLDLTWRYVGALPRPQVPSYQELDVHWNWMLTPRLELGLTGQNLLHASHPEFGSAPGRSVVERSVLLSAAYRY